MIIRINHSTRFHYSIPATHSQSEVRLRPVSDARQTVLDFRLETTPPAKPVRFDSPFGVIHSFSLSEPHEELKIVTESRVETRLANPFEGLNLNDDDWAYYRTGQARWDAPEYLTDTRLVQYEPEVDAIAEVALSIERASVASYLLALNGMIFKLVKYDKCATNVHTTLSEILRDKRGVCQDFAHLMLAACRSQGIPARYVSGYMLSLPGDGTMHPDEAMHAWVECLFPDGVWRAFDPTNNLMANDRYVKVHVGRDYLDVAPTRGVYRGMGEERLEVRVKVMAE